jgi:uncharacterized repeat protein (TIGR04138 family)
VADIPTIFDDCPCVGCEYNLRGLGVDQRCPECGAPIVQTLRRILGIVRPETGAWIRDALVTVENQRLGAVAVKADCTVDAVRFLLHAFQVAKGQAGGGRVTAGHVCDGVRDWANRYFNDTDEAKELLAEWRIACSEDVGRIVFAMVELGHMRAEDGETIRDFDGLFTLDTLFSDPSR